MRRLSAALATGLILIAMLPSAVSADPVTKFTETFVGAGCDTEFDGGYAFVGSGTSSEFGDFAEASVWLEPAVPFEDPPTAGGFTEVVDVSDDGTTVELHATFTVLDPDGNELGEAELAITVERTGDINVISDGPEKTNQNSKTTGIEEFLEGSGTLTLPDSEIAFSFCTGSVGEVENFASNPHSFVSANAGVRISCEWELDEGAAGFFAIDDQFGFEASAFMSTPDVELFAIGSSGSIDVEGVDATVELFDDLTGDPHSASASATFSLLGSPVRSTELGATFRTNLRQQALEPVGMVEFSTGDSFVISTEHCGADSFESHLTNSAPSGQKTGPVPVNDGPDGAIALEPGSRLNAMNVGATNEPELPIVTCPEGIFDDFGRTLWYTIEGTGEAVTIDTAGSNIDTLIGVYVATESGFEEVGCIDDVFSEPVGSTFQAALTIDTEEGVTYFIQVGGFRQFFDEDPQAEAGRIRLAVD